MHNLIKWQVCFTIEAFPCCFKPGNPVTIYIKQRNNKQNIWIFSAKEFFSIEEYSELKISQENVICIYFYRWFIRELMEGTYGKQRNFIQCGKLTIESEEKSSTYHWNYDIGNVFCKDLFMYTGSLICVDAICCFIFDILDIVSEFFI